MIHSLSDLKTLFIENGIEIKEFYGWYLKVKKDTWLMRDGKLYCNGKFIHHKEVLSHYPKSNTKKSWKAINSAILED
jgi:hypothetical protein